MPLLLEIWFCSIMAFMLSVFVLVPFINKLTNFAPPEFVKVMVILWLLILIIYMVGFIIYIVINL